MIHALYFRTPHLSAVVAGLWHASSLGGAVDLGHLSVGDTGRGPTQAGLGLFPLLHCVFRPPAW